MTATTEIPGAFSVLIPAYKAAGYIEPTLASIAAQTHPPAELLIFEDGRFDDVAQRVTAFAKTVSFPVRLLGVEKNAGVSRARNTLMREARGEFIAFLDADDIWAPDHLAQAARCFAAGADVAFSGVTFIDANGAVLPGAAEPSAADLANIPPAMFNYNFVQCTSTLSLRRSWLARVGDFDTTLSHGEDLDLWLRLFSAGAVWRYTGRTSCAYRKHPQSAMGQARYATARLTAFYEKQLSNDLIPLVQRRGALIENLRINARFSWRDDPRAAAAALKRLRQLEPSEFKTLIWWLMTTVRSWFQRRTG